MCCTSSLHAIMSMDYNISDWKTFDSFNDTLFSDVTLEFLNNEETKRRLVPLIYLGLLSLFGIPGNLIIIYIYLVKFERKAVHRTFVVAIALSDFLVCSFVIPFEISQMTQEFTFELVWECKLGRTMKSLFTMASALILVALSVNRYVRICHPLRPQLKRSQAVICILIILGSSVLMALPEVALSGITFHHLENNITGKDCSADQRYAGTLYPKLYSIGKLVLFALCMVVLLILCLLIGRKIVAHEKFRDQFRVSNMTASFTNATFSEKQNGIAEEKKGLNIKNHKHGKYHLIDLYIYKYCLKDRHLLHTSSGENSTRNRSTKKKLNSPTKVTKTALYVSICFIIVFLPYAIIRVLGAVKQGNIMPPSTCASIILPMFSRSHFINNVVNFFIYLRMDLAFRRHCKSIFVDFCSVFKKRRSTLI